MSNSDLTFITNEKGDNLKERFRVLIKDTQYFDALVGYFYTSGFHALYESLEKTEKIRILIGISTNKQTYELMQTANETSDEQMALKYSHSETKEQFSSELSSEMEVSEDKREVESGVQKFIEWLKNEKLEIRAYPSENIHAKLYIMSFQEGDRDTGRVITGSSNFTKAGLVDNLEFNVELKNRADYDFAKQKFEELWVRGVDVSEKYIETIENKTWLSDTVTPYHLYLKFLYEYFKEDISQPEDLNYKYVPEQFKKLAYQEQAVLNAKKILERYGGVFISDVVGLGKTFISALLAQQLDGRTLVLAPPALLDEANPGSWVNVFRKFNIPFDSKSIGQLDHLIKQGADQYQNIIIDEAHRFRTETNQTYEKLVEICRGKRVILVTATPYNNSPKDVLSQIKLFQKVRKSDIPNVPNLERFFGALEGRLAKLDRQKDYEQYMQTVKDNAREIREKVLKYLMVRRTRSEIQNYFAKDLAEQKVKFPEVIEPEALFYELNEIENEVFTKTIELIGKEFTYARYMPMLYYRGDDVTEQERSSQNNLGKFIKILLIKRLESSFYAFRNSLNRFINHHERVLEELENGNVYVSKGYAARILEFLEDEDEDALERLISEEKAKKFPADKFSEKFKEHLAHDLEVLRQIQVLWERIDRDPKLLSLLSELKSREIFQGHKLIIFTESKETADYLAKNLQNEFTDEILAFSGSSGAHLREQVIENFDANARFPKDDYRILITTEVLSEGVNLHRSDVVINYDIPWNPTRLMQRVGRINRVDTPHKTIYTFNFFPTEQANEQLKLKEAAEAKINAFISLLGADAPLLTDGEVIESHQLFSRLMSKKTITGEDETQESELKYLQLIKEIRDKDADLFEKIKKLPKKARTARAQKDAAPSLLTYFRKGSLHKFFMSAESNEPEELDFMAAAKMLEVEPDEKRAKLEEAFYALLEKNKEAFRFATVEEMPESSARGRDTESQVLKILKVKELRRYKGFTEDDENYIESVIKAIEEGWLPKETSRKLLKALKEQLSANVDPLKILALIRTSISVRMLQEPLSESSAKTRGPREVVLSEYVVGS